MVTPLFKKANLPSDDLKNYLSVSGLSFISKLVECVVAKQLLKHILVHNLDNPYQSAYKADHSTETALPSMKNEVHLSLSRGEPTALVLLRLYLTDHYQSIKISSTFSDCYFHSYLASPKVLYWTLCYSHCTPSPSV